MAIEFACPGCQKALRVADEFAGRNAKCPNCETVVQVPAAAEPSAEPLQPAVPPAAAGGAANPYMSPTVDSDQPPGYDVQTGELRNQPVTANAVINYAWQVWKDNMGLLVGVVFFLAVINWVMAFVLGIMQGLFEQNNQQGAAITLAVLGNLSAQLLQLYLGIGQTQITLKAARRQPVQFADLFQGGPRFLPVLGVGVLAMLALMAGFALCIVPGVILALMFWPFYWIVVDDKAPALESFSVARMITSENLGTTSLLWLTSVGFIILGLLALCVGIFFAAALVSMMWSTAYLMMSGQISTQPAEQLDY
jgi:hypothetical protein